MAGAAPRIRIRDEPENATSAQLCSALRTKDRCTRLQSQDPGPRGRLDENLERRPPSRNGWPLQGYWHVGLRGQGVMAQEALAQTPGQGCI